VTVADVTSSIQAIEQRIATISPSAAQVFGGSPSTTSTATTPASFATELQAAGVDPTATDATGETAETDPTALTPPLASTTPLATTTVPTTATAATPASTQYDSLIQQAARDQGVDPALLKGLVQAESNFDPNSVSSVGAQGLTQLMPSTASGLGVANSFDPLQNLEGGARFLAGALKRFGGNEQLALAAYNAGPGAVEKYGGIPPYAETQAYVPRVLGYAAQYRAQGFGQASSTGLAGVAAPVAAPASASDAATISAAEATAPSPTAQNAIRVAAQYLGTPYRFGGSNPTSGFDCSGLVQYAYGQSGVSVPRVAADQYGVGQPIDRASLQPGDTVFFKDSTGYVHHEGMYLGNDQFIQAPHTGDVVKISSLDDPYYAGQFAGGRRVA
jgi:cell wall-associated NlpC family hydrolase